MTRQWAGETALFPGPRSDSSQRPVTVTPGRYQCLPSVATYTHVTQHIHNGITFSHLRLDSAHEDGTGPRVKDQAKEDAPLSRSSWDMRKVNLVNVERRIVGTWWRARGVGWVMVDAPVISHSQEHGVLVLEPRCNNTTVDNSNVLFTSKGWKKGFWVFLTWYIPYLEHCTISVGIKTSHGTL